MSDAVQLLGFPFLAAVAFVLIHGYLGVHVLRRKIVFADLALAQMAALGATVAFAAGHATTSTAGFAYALLFTAIGAVLLTAMRGAARVASHEALIGILYVVATAATILVVDRSPQGAEHVKKILIGSLLTVDPADVAKLIALYAAIGAFHWLSRRPLLALSSDEPPTDRSTRTVWLWDFAFFLSFAIVVTSSVTIAGVLLVFSFLIVPPVIGSLFSGTIRVILTIAWIAGIVACAVGLAASYIFDLPTGATMVTSLALFLVLAGLAKLLIVASPARRSVNRQLAAKVATALALLLALASSAWLILNPAADQPLLALVERVVRVGPADFLDARDREIYRGAVRDAARFQAEAERLDAREKAARTGTPLSDDDIRRIASYQQNFNEMARGERFVQDVLRAKARARERWIVGVPVAVVALVALLALARSFRSIREVDHRASAPASSAR